MARILIVKTGETHERVRRQFGDYEAWIRAGLGYRLEEIVICDPRNGDPLPDCDDVDGMVITGSPSMVTQRKEWSERIAQWLPGIAAKNLPILGICYGHQLLAHAFGGIVAVHPKGREIGDTTIELNAEALDDQLFSGMPSSFRAHVSHSQTVLQLPTGAQLLAHNAHEPHHAFRIGGSAWGVQFHPEFSAAIMQAGIRERIGILTEEGFDVNSLIAAVQEAPEAASLLKRFAAIVRNRASKN